MSTAEGRKSINDRFAGESEIIDKKPVKEYLTILSLK